MINIKNSNIIPKLRLISNNFFQIERKYKKPEKINLKTFDVKENLDIQISDAIYDEYLLLATEEFSKYKKQAFSEQITIRFTDYNKTLQTLEDLNENKDQKLPSSGVILFDKKILMRDISIKIPVSYQNLNYITISSPKDYTLIYDKNYKFIIGIYCQNLKAKNTCTIDIDFNFLENKTLASDLRRHFFLLIEGDGKLKQEDLDLLYKK